MGVCDDYLVGKGGGWLYSTGIGVCEAKQQVVDLYGGTF